MKPITHLGDIAPRVSRDTRFAVHSGCAAPQVLSEHLAEIARAHGPLDLFTLITIGTPSFVPAILAGDIRLTAFVPGRSVRQGVETGSVRILAKPLSQAPRCFDSGEIPVDVLLLQLSAPGADGQMSLGLSCEAMHAAIAAAKIVVAEINRQMPRTLGATHVSPEQIDYCVECDYPPIALEPACGDAIDGAIADNIAALIRDGDVLQTGIGSIPDLTVQRLGHLSGLRIHTGIMTEAVQTLIETGAVDVGAKAGPRGGCVATMAAGSGGFYRFLHDNPSVAFHPCDVTHDRSTLAAIPRLCAVNGALEVDVLGRVNATNIGGRCISGPGGQPDFAAGAVMSPGGKSIIALHATSRDGGESRIVPDLGKRTATVDSRSVTHVVTEYGVALIAGKSGSDLRHELAAIAAPPFRSDLRRA